LPYFANYAILTSDKGTCTVEVVISVYVVDMEAVKAIGALNA